MNTRRQAYKDAKEFVRAKMYYGEGAGIRRKLIKAAIDERIKDPKYKKIFEEALLKQDEAKHAAKAKIEREARDFVKVITKKIPGIVAAIATGVAVYINNKDQINDILARIIGRR